MADFQESETLRMETFSDGVFAIDITLLTFQLKTPSLRAATSNQSLALALFHQWPNYIAYFISFTTIFIIWLNHHRMYNVIQRSDVRFMFYNGLLLLLVSIIPFTTSLLADYINTPAHSLSAALYMFLFAGISGVLFVMWNYATANYRLLKRPAGDVRIQSIRTSHLVSVITYTFAAVVSFLLPFLSILVGLVMVVYLSQLKYHRNKVV
ncbi:TMEM175 family protein [Spirosoma panaciterrae]|uniref:TMEM175 family protein n=1 Tax=Spirosoma panaciterrae TaxID=496058 RepID=UPI0003666645|nr:TMEM175 family protein [Spirosoma panaciterrae]